MDVNVWDVVDDLKAIITADRPVDPQRPADPAIEIGDVVGAASR